jgi:two-component system, OmpR family, response regulator
MVNRRPVPMSRDTRLGAFPLLGGHNWETWAHYARESRTLTRSLCDMDDALNSDDSSKTYHVLIVDDDPATRRMVTSYFEEHDVSASSAADRQELNRLRAGREPSLIILDLRLGREDGLDLLREIRSSSDAPVIIITGHRLEEVDRVVGLELGADDYVTKPFGLRELLARVRAILWRHELRRVGRGREPQRGGYKFGDWKLERDGRRLLNPEGSSVTLTKGEYALLVAFLEAPQRPLAREQLLQARSVQKYERHRRKRASDCLMTHGG